MSNPAGEGILVVLVTFPDVATAESVVRSAVTANLAACGNLVTGVRSIYRWQGAIETAEETLVLFKTTEARVDALQAHVLQAHPYQVPEFVQVQVTGGHPAYLDWVRDGSTAV